MSDNDLLNELTTDVVAAYVAKNPVAADQLSTLIHDVYGSFQSLTGEAAPEEGLRIALELTEAIKKKQGINGMHIMSLGWEAIVPRIIAESGLPVKQNTVL